MIYKYRRAVTPGPNGTTFYFRNTEDNTAIEIADLDGWYYVFVPEDAVLPDQPPEIEWLPVELSDADKSRLRAVSYPCELITEEVQRRIRERYKPEDEQYFARIASSAALGVYQFAEGEEDKLVAYVQYVEDARQWGREERKRIGL
jgi:hypothetical protein